MAELQPAGLAYCRGLLGAAVTAVFLTTLISFAGTMVADVIDGAPPSKLLELVNPLGWALILFVSVVFGLPAAALFLGVAFWLWFRSRDVASDYAAPGLLAGALHASLGILLRLTVGVDGTFSDIDFALIWGGGFLLAFLPRAEIMFALLPASMFAGWLAGMAFTRLSQNGATGVDPAPSPPTAGS